MKRQAIIFALLVLTTFAIFAFLRFFNLDKRLIFDWDQEQFTTQIRDIITNHKFTLLGPRVVGPEGFFLAPYFTYLLVPLFILTHTHPWALLYFIIFFNVIFFAGSIFILSRLFGKWQAIIFLLFWSVSHLLVGYDTIPWWPLLIPFGVLLTLYLLYLVYTRKSLLYWVLLGINLGFFMNMHFQFIFMIVLTAVFIFLSRKTKHFINLKKAVLFIGIFLAMFSPLLFFDMRHHFLNTKLFLTFFIPGHGGHFDPVSWMIVLTNALRPFTYVRIAPLGIGLYIALFFIVRFLSVKKSGFYQILYQSFSLLWIAVPLFFVLYGKRPSEYYFNFLYPLIYIIIIDYFFTIKKTHLLAAVFIMYACINAPLIKPNLNTNFYGLYYKDQVIKKIKTKTTGMKINIALDTWPNGDTGFRYLINYYNIKQTGNPKDTLIIIRTQPHDDGDQRIGGYGLLLPPALRN